MKRLSDDQKTVIHRAVQAASDPLAAEVATSTQEIRDWLSSEGAMAMTVPDKTDFVAAAKQVQNNFAQKRGEEFVKLVAKIQAAAE